MSVVDPERVKRLGETINEHLLVIFQGEGTDELFCGICGELKSLLDYLAEKDIKTLKNKEVCQFMLVTLPRVVDVVLRRSTKRQHVPEVMAILRAVIIILSRTDVFEVGEPLLSRLMEVRNHILAGGSNLRFVPPKELNVSQGYTSLGLFGEHGKCESALLGSSFVRFWPHEWKKYLGGSKAVGHCVCVFVDKKVLGENEETNNDKLWQDGQIISYDEFSCLYTLRSCKGSNIVQSSLNQQNPGGSNEITFQVDLSNTLHFWVDDLYRDEVLSRQKIVSNTQSDQYLKALSFSPQDEGQYIVIENPQKNKYYYGWVKRYHSAKQNHEVIFDDKSSRELMLRDVAVDMNVNILNIPMQILASVEGEPSYRAARVIRDWHQPLLTPHCSSGDIVAAENGQMTGIELPDASCASGTCFLRIELIELYYQRGGFASILSYMSDSSKGPLGLHILIFYMKLVYSFRTKLKKSVLEEIITSLRSHIPQNMLRYEEEQIKCLTKQDLSVLLQGLKDIVRIISPNDKDIEFDTEVLHLRIALKLLRCSQLQKRYFGLSIIREHVEAVFPSINQPRYILNADDKKLHGVGSRSRIAPVLKTDFVEKFILDNDVFELIFGESFHQDLAIKSDFLLVFLSLRGVLGEDQIRIMWQASCGRHETVVRVLYLLILHITPVLHPRLRLSLFKVIASAPPASYSEQFMQLLKDFTLCAIQAFRSERIELYDTPDGNKDVSEGTKVILQAAMEHLDHGVHISLPVGNEPNKLFEKLRKKGKRMWLGFAVLWRFVQDTDVDNSISDTQESYVNESIVDMAVRLLVEMLKEEEFRDEREYVLYRCALNLQLGVSVATSIRIMRLTLRLYPAPRSGWLNNVKSSVKSSMTVTQVIEKLNRPENGNLVSAIFSELESYHSSFKEHFGSNGGSHKQGVKIGNSTINMTRINVAGKRSRLSHLNALVERLQLLMLIVKYSPNVVMGMQQVLLLWKVYIEDITTSQIRDIFIHWIGILLMQQNKQFDMNFLCAVVQQCETSSVVHSKLYWLVNSKSTDVLQFFEDDGDEKIVAHPAFAEGVLETLFVKKILPLASVHADSPDGKMLHRPWVASFCMKLFLFVNAGMIRMDLESGQGWYRTSSPMLGLEVLWRIATDATDDYVYEASSYLLVELHHRLLAKPKDIEDIRTSFLKTCFTEMSRSIQCVQTEEANSAEDGVYNEQTLSRRVARYVNLLDLFIKRFDVISVPYTVLHIINSRNGLLSTSTDNVDTYRSSTCFLFSVTTTIGNVRNRIANHFNVPSEVVGLSRAVGMRYGRNQSSGQNALLFCDADSPFEALEKDQASLQSLKCKPMETLVVRRIEGGGSENKVSTEVGNGGSSHLFGRFKKEDIFTTEDLESDFISQLNPFSWLNLRTVSSNAPSQLNNINCGRVFDDISRSGNVDYDSSGHFDLFAMPQSPLPYHSDMCLVLSGDNNNDLASREAKDSKQCSQVTNVIGKYLDNHPSHFSQLFQVLDGYFSICNESAVRKGSRDVSAAVWDIVQSFPSYKPLLLKIQKLLPLPAPNRLQNISIPDENRSFFRSLFDITSPYSTLYSLQIVDSILTSFVPLEGQAMQGFLRGTKSSRAGQKTKQSAEAVLALGRSQLEWGWKFIKLGGAEHLMSLLNSLLTKWGNTIRNADSPKEDLDVVANSRVDIEILCIVMLLRVAHKLLLFDISYGKWQLDPVAKAGALHVGETLGAFITPGTILSYVDLESFYMNIVSTVFSAVSAHNALDSNIMSEVQLSTIESLIDHSVVLLFGLSKTTDNCIDLLFSTDVIHRFIRAITVRPKEASTRRAGCRALLQAATCVLIRTAISQGTAKSTKVRRSSTIGTQPKPQVMKRSSTIPDTSRSHSSSCSLISEPEKKQRRMLFHAVFNLIMQSIHPLYNSVSDWTNRDVTEVCIGPESYENGGEVYSLIAGLIALQCRPNILSDAKLDFITLPRQGSVTSNSANTDWVKEDQLCVLFFQKLITHASREVFHSDIPDETLTGILRVLLVLSWQQPTQKQLLFGLRGKPNKLHLMAKSEATSLTSDECDDEEEATSLIEYLYFRCLFPRRLHGQKRKNAGNDLVRTSPAVCLASSSRKLSYALLLEVGCHNTLTMTEMVDALFDKKSGDATSVLLRGDFVSNEFGSLYSIFSESLHGHDIAISKFSSISRNQWEYDPNVLIKQRDTYLGLVNQGCTCYMNAFLQQLFHVKSFANAFLGIESNPNDVDDDFVKDNLVVLFEMQTLFCYLKLSQKKYCDTMDFCKVFKDYDMQPVRLGEQKDINEFAAMLFDKLESNSTCKDLIKAHFGGKLVYEVKSIDDDCAYKSEREEPYFIVTAEVKGKNNLEDSLELFVAGEILSGENRIEVEVESDDENESPSKRKVDALRRCSFRTLPPILIIHLKRFEFDLETLNRRKLNDYFTFPTTLDMFPYTEEGIRQNEMLEKFQPHDMKDPGEGASGSGPGSSSKHCMYSLKGVIVHTGAIDSGHYYSFIRVPSRSSEASSEESNQWMEFNDTTVSPFSPDSIPGECFGGSVPGVADSAPHRWKQHSAYMLIYEREEWPGGGEELSSPPPPVKRDDEPVSSSLAMVEAMGSRKRTSSTSLDCLHGAVVSSCKNSSSKTPRPLRRRGSSHDEDIAPNVLSAVDEENSSFILDLMHFNKDYLLFFWSLLRSAAASGPSSPDERDLDYGARETLLARIIYRTLIFCFQVLFRARAQQCIPLFMEALDELLAKDILGFGAFAVLTELTKLSPPIDGAAEQAKNALICESEACTPHRKKQHDVQQDRHSKEISALQECVHPMLATAFVECPHTFTIDFFSQFLMSCIKSLRRFHDEHHQYLTKHPAHGCPDVGLSFNSVKVDMGFENESNDPPVDTEKLRRDAINNISIYTSCVTRMIANLLLIAENYQPVDAMRKRSYEVMSGFLRSFVLMGKEEMDVLVSLDGVYRLICSTITLHPVHARMPFRDCLKNAIDLVCTVVKSAQFPDASGSGAKLKPRDLNAFTSQMFLGNVLHTSRPFSVTAQSTYSNNFISALKKVCNNYSTNDLIQFLGFFLEKSFQLLSSNSTLTSDQSDELRLSFGIFSSLLSHVIESQVMDRHQDGIKERAEFVVDQLLGLLITQTSRICRSKSPSCMDFSKQVLQLIYRVGIQSEVGYKSVLSLKGQWKKLSLQFANSTGDRQAVAK